MGWRFQRRIKILPGVTLNVGKNGVSTSIGTRGAHVTVGENGVRTTVGIPGTGISYTSVAKTGTSANGPGCSYLKQCPYCGHRMRRYWTNCPSCHHLLPQVGRQGASAAQRSLPSGDVSDACRTKQSGGEGWIIWGVPVIVVAIMWLLF